MKHQTLWRLVSDSNDGRVRICWRETSVSERDKPHQGIPRRYRDVQVLLYLWVRRLESKSTTVAGTQRLVRGVTAQQHFHLVHEDGSIGQD